MFAPHIGELVEKMTTLAGSDAKPAEYPKSVLNRLIPTILPYEPDTWAAFSYANFKRPDLHRQRDGRATEPHDEHGAGRRCADPGEVSEARRVPVLQRAPHGHLTRYGVPATWLAGLARLPSGPT
jgi:hypothetical protein